MSYYEVGEKYVIGLKNKLKILLEKKTDKTVLQKNVLIQLSSDGNNLNVF